jgi:hypothetical protein
MSKKSKADKALLLPKGAIPLVAVASKGTVVSYAQPASDGKVIPSFTHEGTPSRDLPAVAIGVGVHPWSGRKDAYAASYAALGAYVATRAGKSSILPLKEALRLGLVKPLKLYRENGAEVTVYVPKSWKEGMVLPLLLGTLDNGALGRFEPIAHPDAKRRERPCYARLHVKLSLTKPEAAKPTGKAEAKAKA